MIIHEPSCFSDCRTCAAAPAGSPMSCRQSKKVTRSKSFSGYPFAVATSKRVFAVTSPDIGHLGAALQFIYDPVECRQPVAHQIVVVAGAEEPSDRTEEATGVV